jgi:hypothetical protein
VSVIELSDEETVAILAETFIESLADLRDKTRQVAVLKRIHALLDSSAPQHFIYETVQGCDELQVIRVGGDRRIYCKLVLGVPAGDEHYNVLFVFYVDPHNYDAQQLATFDAAADERLREVTSFDDVEDVQAYLDRMNAFSTEEIEERIDQLEQ